MPYSKLSLIAGLCLLLGASLGTSFAAPIVNAPMPIDRRLEVQVIQVSNSSGAQSAPLFGTIVQQGQIFGTVNTIWAQAGIDVSFKFRLTPYLDNFTLSGTAGSNNPRPTSDLNSIITKATNAGGVLDPNIKVVNLFMVQIVPGFSQTGNNTSNGLAFIDGNGVTLWAGPNLTSFEGGRDVIASVLAHELGHNLGLSHIVEGENLMQAGGSPDDGERLNASQIANVRDSSLLIAIPEPNTLALLIFGLSSFALRRHAR
jgi:hypothetical protein